MENLFIVNPAAGKGKGYVAGNYINEYLKYMNTDYEIYYTTKPGDALKLANSYKVGSRIYSVGGDGTLNEVINGMAFGDSSLTVIPVGTGNDFYKSIKDLNEEYLDVGKVNDRFFINIASLGLDAEVANYANELKKNGKATKSAYVKSLIHSFIKFNGIDLKLNTDDIDEESLTILAVCNGSVYGNGFKIAPKALVNDGLFDIVSVPKLSKLHTLRLIKLLLSGKHLNDDKVRYFRTPGLKVESKLPLICNIDGEIIKDKIFSFEMYESLIKLENNDEYNIKEMLKSKKLMK